MQKSPTVVPPVRPLLVGVWVNEQMSSLISEAYFREGFQIANKTVSLKTQFTENGPLDGAQL